MSRALALASQRAYQVSGRALARSAIPDSGLLHWYVVDRHATTSQINDREDSLNLTGTISQIVADDFDGYDAADFDGSNDGIDASKSTPVSPGFDVYFVAKMESISASNQQLHDFNDTGQSDYNVRLANDNNGDWQLLDSAGNYEASTNTNTNWHLLHVEVRSGANTEFLLDDTELISVSMSPNDFNGITVAQRFDGTHKSDMRFAEMAHYDTDASGYSKSDVVDYFRSRYPSLSL
jgi:hypothetical protein